MSSFVEWNTTPAEILSGTGWKFKKRGNWFVVQICPFCSGGDHGDKGTFIVHTTDGNYSCVRMKCGAAGTFWSLIETTGRDPRHYRGEQIRSNKKVKKRFIYGR